MVVVKAAPPPAASVPTCRTSDHYPSVGTQAPPAAHSFRAFVERSGQYVQIWFH
ncbi:hypothetical protein GCM10029976_073620 [Kribbella albertanoniae]